RAAWFDRREQSSDDDWAPPPPEPRERAGHFGSLFGELRSRDGQLSLQVQELVESLTARQQIGVAALLCALALALVVMSKPQGLVGSAPQPTSVHVHSVFP